MTQFVKPHKAKRRSAGFTLVELLITVTIIGIMASMVLFAYFGATEAAKEQKTKTLIAKLDAVLKTKWDSYRTRRVPIDMADKYTDSNGNGVWDSGENLTLDWNGNSTYDGVQAPLLAAKARLDALRDIMRMELPDRWSDIYDPPLAPFRTTDPALKIARPAISQTYLRRLNAAAAINSTYPTGEHAGAECLYLIVMAAVAEEGDSRDVFRPDDIKDTDGDTIPEFVDGWGRPIKFLRWAPGFQFSELQVSAFGEVTSTNGNSVTVMGNGLGGSGLNGSSGAYVGGSIVSIADAAMPYSPSTFTTNTFAKIVGYQSTNGSPPYTFNCATAPPSGKVAILSPDPFDPRGAAPGISFALYPLIYSGGSDKCYGINPDIEVKDANGNPGPLRYAHPDYSVMLNPFKTPDNGGMVGAAQDDSAEQNFVSKAWLDNIHNHMIGTK